MSNGPADTGIIFQHLRKLTSKRPDTTRLDVGDNGILWDGSDPPLEEEDFRYPDPGGYGPLVEHLRDKVARVNGLDGDVVVFASATLAVNCALRKLLRPGSEELLVLAPYWPLLPLEVWDAFGTLTEVPAYLAQEPERSIAQAIEEAVSSQTSALYINSPNNPCGEVLERRDMEEILLVAERHDLYIISDEAYEDFIWRGSGHCSIGSLPGAAKRTLTVFSFSKSLSMAGHRLGYAVIPHQLSKMIIRTGAASGYAPPRHTQRIALDRLERGWPLRLHKEYAPRHKLACEVLQPWLAGNPRGGFYVFLDLRRELHQSGLTELELLTRAVDEAGISYIPGSSAGSAYEGYARVCFASLGSLDETNAGVHKLRSFLDGLS